MWFSGVTLGGTMAFKWNNLCLKEFENTNFEIIKDIRMILDFDVQVKKSK